MNKHKILSLLLILPLLFVGCSKSEPKSDVKVEQNQEEKQNQDDIKKENPTSEIQKDVNTKKEKELVEKAEEVIKTTPLFENVYMKYKDSVGHLLFNGIESTISSLGYRYEIQQPTEDDLGTIEIFDDSNNEVTLMFYPSDSGIELLCLLQYSNGTNAISITNDLHLLKTPELGTFEKGADKPNKKVSTIKDQIKFIFAN